MLYRKLFVYARTCMGLGFNQLFIKEAEHTFLVYLRNTLIKVVVGRRPYCVLEHLYHVTRRHISGTLQKHLI